ncbi:MAG: hypothetical protein COA99_17270 [Moraxellaceae bacterium]|nr:MAG: hypothetical protein COA99_17270 [Moraxellaceae bacterium]
MTASTATNLAQLLMQAFFWADEGFQNTLKERSEEYISKAQSQVFISLSDGITRPSAIAARLGITRQALHQTVNELVGLGYVVLKPDPLDLRAKIITYTSKGKQLALTTTLGLSEIEAQLIGRIGVNNVQVLRDVMAQNWGDPYVPTELLTS